MEFVYCSKCPKKFRTKKLLQYHERYHEEKNVECDKCHKIFRNSLLLESHLAVHLQDVFYSCDQCDKQFRQKTNLSRHRKIHKNENVIASLNEFENC